jgi:hypothetical protein
MNKAFKEWAVVCEAMGEGRQSLILRKGGIAEGRKGFSFEHPEFCLFPTWFHEQVERTILPPGTPLPEENPEGVEIRWAARVEWAGFVRDRDKLARLREYHILSDATVEERFCYDETAGLHVAVVRVLRLCEPRLLAWQPGFRGCRSWVDVPEIDACGTTPVLDDAEHARRTAAVRAVLD